MVFLPCEIDSHFFPRNAIEADIDHGHAGPRSLTGAPLVPRRRRDCGPPGSTMLWVETTSARFSIERAPKRARQVSHSRRLLRPGITRISAPRNASARVGTETGQVL